MTRIGLIQYFATDICDILVCAGILFGFRFIFVFKVFIRQLLVRFDFMMIVVVVVLLLRFHLLLGIFFSLKLKIFRSSFFSLKEIVQRSQTLGLIQQFLIGQRSVFHFLCVQIRIDHLHSFRLHQQCGIATKQGDKSMNGICWQHRPFLLRIRTVILIHFVDALQYFMLWLLFRKNSKLKVWTIGLDIKVLDCGSHEQQCPQCVDSGSRIVVFLLFPARTMAERVKYIHADIEYFFSEQLEIFRQVIDHIAETLDAVVIETGRCQFIRDWYIP
mmetsp:Transcript_7893/g.12938  ORF Transcript_7893/g.12938 Transcript_7893/m.12938 type:complete len:273 (+) Transcript_7893:447-1265(+)